MMKLGLFLFAALLGSIGLTIVSAGAKQTNAILFFTGINCVLFLMLIAIVIRIINTASLPKAKSVTPVPEQELIQSILSFNHDQWPLEFTAKDHTVTVQLKLADSSWYEFYAKAGIKEQYSLKLRFDEAKHIVFAIEETKTYTTTLGIPTKAFVQYFRGWHPYFVKKETAWGLKELFPPTIDKLYSIDFRPQDIRSPIVTQITDSGWNIVPCSVSLALGI